MGSFMVYPQETPTNTASCIIQIILFISIKHKILPGALYRQNRYITAMFIIVNFQEESPGPDLPPPLARIILRVLHNNIYSQNTVQIM